jgi:hypothetical protein
MTKQPGRPAASPRDPAVRQHFIARFYLRNFAEPMFSDNLWVYDVRKQRWERRSPNGVGWFWHLCSMIDMEGKRSDDFDQFLKQRVEDPACPALKKLATGEALEGAERSAVALFIALTAARSPRLRDIVVAEHLGGLAPADRAELDDLVQLWCTWTGTRHDERAYGEFLKPSSFGAAWAWSLSLQRYLLEAEWHLVRTTRDQPFITSDWPVYAHWDREQDVRLVSFPVSSEVALIIFTGGQLNPARDPKDAAKMVNLQTMCRATEFVVACKTSFPGDAYLPRPDSGKK